MEMKKLLEESHNGYLEMLDFEKVTALFTEIHEIGEHKNHWLMLNFNKDSSWVEYGLFQFFSSNCDGSEVKIQHVFSGCGPSGSLRELRHTYWGSEFDGYTFYLPGQAVIQALQILSKYFDMD